MSRGGRIGLSGSVGSAQFQSMHPYAGEAWAGVSLGLSQQIILTGQTQDSVSLLRLTATAWTTTPQPQKKRKSGRLWKKSKTARSTAPTSKTCAIWITSTCTGL